MNREQEKLNQWFQTVKFRDSLPYILVFAGVAVAAVVMVVFRKRRYDD